MTCLVTILAAGFLIRVAAALGASPQWMRTLQDGLLAALFVAVAAVLIAYGTRRRIYRAGMALATGWAVVNVAVFERSRSHAIAEAVVLLVVYSAIAWRKNRGDVRAQRLPVALTLACAMLAILPAKLVERPVAAYRLHSLAGTDAMRRWIVNARENDVSIDPAELAVAARALLAMEGDQAWDTAIELVNYRWALPTPERKHRDSAVPIRLATWGTLRAEIFQVTDAPSEPAELTPIGSASSIRSGQFPTTLIVKHAGGPGAVLLDGWRMRNVVFDRVPIAYNGGPLHLENVSFPKCTFYAVRNERGRHFLRAALSKLVEIEEIGHAGGPAGE